MYEQLELDNPELDNLLAQFTDRVLASKEDVKAVAQSDDAMLRNLQETVLLLRRTISQTTPDAAMSERIHARLATAYQAEWQKLERAVNAPVHHKTVKKSNWWKSFQLRSILSNRHRLTLSLAFVMAILVLGVILLDPELNVPITGTAGTANGSTPLFILLGILLVIGGLIWFFRSKR